MWPPSLSAGLYSKRRVQWMQYRGRNFSSASPRIGQVGRGVFFVEPYIRDSDEI
jgi:hypothetical protein